MRHFRLVARVFDQMKVSDGPSDRRPATEHVFLSVSIAISREGDITRHVVGKGSKSFYVPRWAGFIAESSNNEIVVRRDRIFYGYVARRDRGGCFVHRS